MGIHKTIAYILFCSLFAISCCGGKDNICYPWQSFNDISYLLFQPNGHTQYQLIPGQKIENSICWDYKTNDGEYFVFPYNGRITRKGEQNLSRNTLHSFKVYYPPTTSTSLVNEPLVRSINNYFTKLYSGVSCSFLSTTTMNNYESMDDISDPQNIYNQIGIDSNYKYHLIIDPNRSFTAGNLALFHRFDINNTEYDKTDDLIYLVGTPELILDPVIFVHEFFHNIADQDNDIIYETPTGQVGNILNSASPVCAYVVELNQLLSLQNIEAPDQYPSEFTLPENVEVDCAEFFALNDERRLYAVHPSSSDLLNSIDSTTIAKILTTESTGFMNVQDQKILRSVLKQEHKLVAVSPDKNIKPFIQESNYIEYRLSNLEKLKKNNLIKYMIAFEGEDYKATNADPYKNADDFTELKSLFLSTK